MECSSNTTVDTLESQQPSPPKGASFFRTCFNGINALQGLGILTIPYALSQGGWLSLLILLLVAALSYYTALLLQRCMDTDPLIKTYTGIGEAAFGRKGRIIVSIFLYLELYLAAVEFLILDGDTLNKLFPDFYFHLGSLKWGGKPVFIILTALLILPTTWLKSLGLLAYVSAGGVLSTVILMAAVFWVGAADGVGFRERGETWRWSGLPTAISLYAFIFGGHSVFPTISDSMKDRTRFPKVLLFSFVLTGILYGLMAIQGYLMYGQHLLSQITLNLPNDNVISKIAMYTTLISPITKYAMVISPVAIAIETSLPFSTKNKLISPLIRTILVLTTMVVAIVLPFYGYIMAFMGASTSISVSMLFPCLCYLKMNKASTAFGLELVGIIVILVLGVFVAVIGTFTSLRDIVMHLHTR